MAAAALRKLWTFRSFFAEIESHPPNTQRAILEVAGKDSVAAAISYLQNHTVTELIGIGIFHRGFHGNFSEPEIHFKQISAILHLEFYYPLFAEIIQYVIRERCTPDQIWIQREIQSILHSIL